MEVERFASHDGLDVWGIAGDVDLWAAPELHALVADKAETERGLVLDLSRVTFIDSTGIGVLLAAQERALGRSLRFALRTNASEPVMRFLGVTGASERFEWISAGGEDEGSAGVREPRRPRPSGGSAAATDRPT